MKTALKKALFAGILASTVAGTTALAQTQNRNQMPRKYGITPNAERNRLISQALEKSLLTLDYNSWFEQVTVSHEASGGLQESQALYYGLGLGFEKNWYKPKWGWGFGLSYLTGSATGGDKAGALNYFQARVPWWAARVSPRLFLRWGARTDFGLTFAAFYKQSNWPKTANEYTVSSGSEMITGPFLDMRVRFNPKIEMMQGFGMVYKDMSIYWRLGLAYRL